MEAFPDPEALAAAPEEEVLKVWQGLGYYSRARNLHRAARELVTEHAGVFPSSYEEILKMKGVGPYTAAAIASICFGEARAAVDGNVIRVLARLYGVEEAVNSSRGMGIIRELADSLMEEALSADPQYLPGIHNQAMMEFGALQCTPRNPDCSTCPLSGQCVALLAGDGSVERLPVKKPKKKPQQRWLYFYVIVNNNHVLLKKNTGPGIWQSLYTFPVVESGKEIPEEMLHGEMLRSLMAEMAAEPQKREETMKRGEATKAEETCPDYGLHVQDSISPLYRHQLSHRTLHARFIRLRSSAPLPFPLKENYIDIPVSETERYPVPRLMERYMKVAKF